MSYHGATLSNEGDPVHYKAAGGRKFFDPGNHMYATALDLLLLDTAEPGWNQETKGDILEGLLGWHFLIYTGHESVRDIHRAKKQNVARVAAITHYVMTNVWRIRRICWKSQYFDNAIGRVVHGVRLPRDGSEERRARRLMMSEYPDYFVTSWDSNDLF